MVIDTGRSGHETAGLLSLAGKRRIDALTLTHSHGLTMPGGLAYILKRYSCRSDLDNDASRYPEV